MAWAPVPEPAYRALPSLGSSTCSSISSAKRSPQSGAIKRSCRKASSLSVFVLFTLSTLFVCLLIVVKKILAAAQLFRQTLHLFARVRVAVHVAIVLAVAEVLHQRRRRIAQMQRHWNARGFGGVSHGGEVRIFHGIGFRRASEIDRGL